MDAAVDSPLTRALAARAPSIVERMLAWRRDIHAHPELGNREERTAALVAAHLRALGLEVRTGIAHTGVAAVLRGGRPGPTVALRADMDALPVAEEVDLPFASRARTRYNGEDVGVMHACGHDCHTAILMAAAELLAAERAALPGTVLFVFQPAEEGVPEGEDGGARMMLDQGLFDDPRPDAVFGLHVVSILPTGVIGYRHGPLLASVDNFHITVQGRQTHGALPWLGVDPIVASAQVVLGLQTIVSRQVDIAAAPSVVTVGMIRGGVRENIVPDDTHMVGTIRTFDEAVRDELHRRVEQTATHIACACGASARVRIARLYPATVNHAGLTDWSVPRLARVPGVPGVRKVPKLLGGEDFSFYQRRVPGFFWFVGVTPPGRDPLAVPANHSPRFFVDEAALLPALRSLLTLASEYLADPPSLAPVAGGNDR